MAIFNSNEFTKGLLAAASKPCPSEDEAKRSAEIKELVELMDRCGREAQANGLTEALLKEILRDDSCVAIVSPAEFPRASFEPPSPESE